VSRSDGTRLTTPVQLGQRGLCRVHCERLVHKLDGVTEDNRPAQAAVREVIWQLYSTAPTPRCTPMDRKMTSFATRVNLQFIHPDGSKHGLLSSRAWHGPMAI
jgi:hypothetical protein